MGDDKKRYIDADALYKKLKKFYGLENGVLISADAIAAISAIDNAPDEDVQEVKRGKWKVDNANNTDNKDTIYHCSKCGNALVAFTTPYCSNCGAKMDNETNN